MCALTQASEGRLEARRDSCELLAVDELSLISLWSCARRTVASLEPRYAACSMTVAPMILQTNQHSRSARRSEDDEPRSDIERAVVNDCGARNETPERIAPHGRESDYETDKASQHNHDESRQEELKGAHRTSDCPLGVLWDR